ncbi:MAG: outer membrane protein assembly factor BamB [Gammaproteobacteria bacterium]|nr:outer membrane protein assembly factor BamB [Gammaproteobacteria bacterium]NIR81865.1 outer membrane protein assembly factor BamB [Gammaproteobacteria bacterium]NIR88697.1 outer membrane protein assembly factor BamB [Gammaproteobacteria bacterium]NIU02973.1 outer membrane protein assembly factor BamB [Gammaproteobacteria bacterium]NIV50494.1 outer membrane protein assembly factor BamB [Gammaproteobacteria bacterium]
MTARGSNGSRPSGRTGLYLLLVASLSVNGCGVSKLWKQKDNTEPPTPLVELEPLTGIRTVWQRRIGSGTEEQYLRLAPEVGNGRVFAADPAGNVYALDAGRGRVIWQRRLDIPLSGGPGVGDGLVLVGSSEGDVVALDRDSGEVRWTARASSEILAAPQAADGVVVARTVDGKLFALNAADGSRLWVYDRTVPVLSLRGTGAPRLVDGMAIAGFDSGTLVAVSLNNAQPLWETQIAVSSGRSELERMVDIDGDPLIVGDTVYAVTFQGQLAAVDLGTGNVLWRRDMSSYTDMGVDSRYVYVTDERSHVWALDRFTSASLWRQVELQARRVTAPVVSGDYVVVGDFEGYVHWLRREDGQFAARVRLDESAIMAPPVAEAGLVYVYTAGGTLAALRPE